MNDDSRNDHSEDQQTQEIQENVPVCSDNIGFIENRSVDETQFISFFAW